MNATDLRQCLLQQFDLRIEPEMSEYVLRQLNSAAGSIPVIGGDARTGAPIRKIIPAPMFRTNLSTPNAP